MAEAIDLNALEQHPPAVRQRGAATGQRMARQVGGPVAPVTTKAVRVAIPLATAVAAR
ncbi:hypothetical protein ACTIVE_6817 [Actinomadura verrucosospora]|uniref:Uncharacterized protein n=2 Tax=Actinomadura verrucosospora TaxID=46165 RepID=A0A7D4A0H4_ACTVE|nr:hypothetical protein ACTIVE_6817 [Actinomadura verrucosospora]